jgi:hypothetical protein
MPNGDMAPGTILPPAAVPTKGLTKAAKSAPRTVPGDAMNNTINPIIRPMHIVHFATLWSEYLNDIKNP